MRALKAWIRSGLKPGAVPRAARAVPLPRNAGQISRSPSIRSAPSTRALSRFPITLIITSAPLEVSSRENQRTCFSLGELKSEPQTKRTRGSRPVSLNSSGLRSHGDSRSCRNPDDDPGEEDRKILDVDRGHEHREHRDEGPCGSDREPSNRFVGDAECLPG